MFGDMRALLTDGFQPFRVDVWDDGAVVSLPTSDSRFKLHLQFDSADAVRAWLAEVDREIELAERRHHAGPTLMEAS